MYLMDRARPALPTTRRSPVIGPAEKTAHLGAPHALPTAEVLSRLATDAERGLDEEEAQRRRSLCGPNELPDAPGVPPWKRLAAQFNQLMIWILVAAAAISGVLGDVLDAAVIVAVVALNGVLGYLQEERAGRALAALRRLSSPVSHARRGGVLRTLPARDLVPGDVIELEAGDHVPADAKLVQSVGLRVQEAALTGESTPVGKDHHPILDRKTPLADRQNMVHMATVVAAGKGIAVVVATGAETELGHVAAMLRTEPPDSTPLQRRLQGLADFPTGLSRIRLAESFPALMDRRRSEWNIDVTDNQSLPPQFDRLPPTRREFAMSRKITLDQVRREMRARACQHCPLRSAGNPGDPLDANQPLDCEASCDLFTHLPTLERFARQLDPMLSSYDTVLRKKIAQTIESITRSHRGERQLSPLVRHGECLIQTLTELADQ